MHQEHTPRILLVDDDPCMLRSAKRWLERHLSATVVTAPHGPAALAIVEEALPFDAAVIDWDMPVMNGGALISELATLRPDLPCFVWTASIVDLPTHVPVVAKLRPQDLVAALGEVLASATTRRSGIRLRPGEDENAETGTE